ncbi:SGNH/GDSL hydrolase family protein [Amycolatopsis sp. GM8]|uniref:SGNH/GDSL hydrolase family protein n=1 Tax=Amycolatopsis sp. GM8 TaxID=2896530 RepID=UPI0027DF19EA|nr:SGNH/GDSL hydrolase family protein [Amycolatopsis sp. GM8]
MKRTAMLITTTVVAALVAIVVDAVPSDAAGASSAWCTSQHNVAIVGTSADTGYGTTGYPSNAQTYQPTTYGWTLRFANSLHAQWGTTMENYAHNGALASDYLPGGRWTATTSATTDITAKQPELVIIDLGGNEFYSQVPPNTFATNLTNVVNSVKAARPGATILLSTYAQLAWAPNPDAATENYTWSQYATQIYNTAVTDGVAMIDMRQYIPAAASTNLPNPSPWNSDNIHLNDAGNLAEYGGFWGWASAIASIC